MALGIDVTLTDRRTLIIKDCASVATVKESFPYLFDEEEVSGIFTKIEDLRYFLTHGEGDRALNMRSQEVKASLKFN